MKFGKFVVFLCIAMFLLGFVPGLYALPIYEGYVRDSIQGANDVDVVKEILGLGDREDLSFYARYDINFDEDEDEDEDDEIFETSTTEGLGTLNLTFDSFNDGDRTEPIAGQWTTEADIVAFVLNFGSYSAVFSIDPGAREGDWSIPGVIGEESRLRDRHIQALSHFNAYTSARPSPVPEPTIMFLLGVGLVGIAGFGRKKLNQKK